MIGGGFHLAGVCVMVGWWWLMPCWGVCDGGCYLVGHAWWRSGGCAGGGWSVLLQQWLLVAVVAVVVDVSLLLLMVMTGRR